MVGGVQGMLRAEPAQLAKLRAICLAYPEAHEVEQFGRPWFKAGRRPFAAFTGDQASPVIALATPKDDQVALCGMDPARFFPSPYLHHHGWTSMRLEERVPWDLVEELVETAYRNVALQRMLKALDES